jgi:hypothetical protein
MGCKYYSLFLELVECEYGMFGRRQKKSSKSGQAAVAAKVKQNLLGQQRRKPVSSIKKIMALFFGKKLNSWLPCAKKLGFCPILMPS